MAYDIYSYFTTHNSLLKSLHLIHLPYLVSASQPHPLPQEPMQNLRQGPGCSGPPEPRCSPGGVLWSAGNQRGRKDNHLQDADGGHSDDLRGCICQRFQCEDTTQKGEKEKVKQK